MAKKELNIREKILRKKIGNFMSYDDLSLIPIDYSWSFSNKTQKDTNYITHGIYTYPAKYSTQK